MVRFIPFVAVAAALPLFTEAFSPNVAKVVVANSVQRQTHFQFPKESKTISTSTSLDALTTTELPDKLYFKKETPKVLGGVKIGLRKLVVVTGASSGLGLNCAVKLAETGRHYVVMACRDVEKAKKVAKEMGMSEDSYTVMKLELGNLQSVRDFVANLKAFKSARPLTSLVCNAAVYRPTDPEPAFTDDGFEMSMGVNHLGHFLLCNLLLNDMSKAKNARMCIVGSITGNTNTVGGGLVYPQADLGDLKGLDAGGKQPITMADGKPFFGAKAYKDSKVCNMMTVSELHNRYHDSTGIVFSSMYPGCIAETSLFREKRKWFRKGFPWFMKYVTGGYVGMEEAGERLAQVIDDPNCDKSNVYWSWNGGAKQVGRWSKDGKPKGAGGSGGEIFQNDQSDAVRNPEMARRVWDASANCVGLTENDVPKAKRP
uniref:protochlorophyllide reductase n=1 Tax=Eucampia antarctica TaxID=49252 RepID=A0A7S2RJ07_9STRA|mmetsp:Transcript_22786/g.21922  ORF Transcript_22786/g.21922 Transcript_22786/m.21922 type:complete len:428 (+) Transcript_22786:100-1383(+)|eukprot:CAMPEP_0197831736 /NCGR_PEP_ID=MMETSP1437-20131217/11817_1 /TAXON_ID=49252 ORGANISM="Eucampia antarctica, Strain CCMP1452" /NCGR_SAMPLE_ID=MMETSP1437 /ASSEMBLY_ACC=CAM_ASM_001096 /LENGTH=427 /DNA_ID=CAMNT_0043434775 /DNA_START=98 /DNA_END=1381 /DNA_ORIENTATION=+